MTSRHRHRLLSGKNLGISFDRTGNSYEISLSIDNGNANEALEIIGRVVESLVDESGDRPAIGNLELPNGRVLVICVDRSTRNNLVFFRPPTKPPQ